MHVNRSPTRPHQLKGTPAPTSPAQLHFSILFQTQHLPQSLFHNSFRRRHRTCADRFRALFLLLFHSAHIQRHASSTHFRSSLHRRNHLLLRPILHSFSESLTALLLYRPHAREYRRTCHLCHIWRFRINIPSDNWQSGFVTMDSSKKLQAHNVVVHRSLV